MESTTFFGGWYNTLTRRAIRAMSCRAAMPRSVCCKAIRSASTLELWRSRARGAQARRRTLTAVAGIGWETTSLKGINTVYRYHAERPDGDDRLADIGRPAIPEHRARIRACSTSRTPSGSFAAASPRAMERRRSETCSSLSNGRQRQQYAAQDAAEPGLRPRFRLDAEQRAEAQRDRLLRILQERTGDAGYPGRSTERELHLQRARNRSIAGWNLPPTGSSIRAGGSRRPIPISTKSTPNTPRTSATGRRLQLQPCGQQDSRRFAERTDGAARL